MKVLRNIEPFPMRFISPEDGHKVMRCIRDRLPIPDRLYLRPWNDGYEEAQYEMAFVQLEKGESIESINNINQIPTT